jgi:hypothetical protein
LSSPKVALTKERNTTIIKEFIAKRGREKKVAVRWIRWSGRVGKVAWESRRGGGDMSDGGRGTSNNGGREERQWRVHKHMDSVGRRQT